MKFQDKFKPGDIICSDRFHNGLCMVVESSGISLGGEFRYRCNDLVRDAQNWLAYEKMYLTRPYSWRIATDNDIANYLSRFIHIPLGKVGYYKVSLLDNGILIDDGVEDGGMILDAQELVQLGKIINERVIKEWEPFGLRPGSSILSTLRWFGCELILDKR
jgi:hypothetical protein